MLRRGLAPIATGTIVALAALSTPGAPALPSESLDGIGQAAARPGGLPTAVTGDEALDAGEVTLLTGDTVTVQRLGTGDYATTVTSQRLTADGAPVTFRTVSTPEGAHYVFPSDAGPAIAAGIVDRELFDVRRLVEAGYADTDELPVIVQYADQAVGRAETGAASLAATLRARTGELPGSSDVRALESINAAGVAVSAQHLEAFWGDLRNRLGAAAHERSRQARPAEIERVWLDGPVHPTLDQSVAQIGAPAAWQAGLDGAGVSVAVLDTGIDQTHPDLTGKIVEAVNFTTEDSAVDRHGHGTHVASTIAGSGAASDSRYRGVAPGVSLLVGKVLDDNGDGRESWLIDGMEWATAADAQVVNMSLGTDAPSDGNDPLSLAVDELTERTGTLFVVAAGNTGPNPRTVAAPGAAAAALTVGAVDKTDRLADFSSRGPLTRSFALKPDITAPGVAITAARAAGTSLGTAVGEHYTTAKGTSMATPHVAGAAAILAQQHPHWQAEQLKAALMGSAVSPSGLSGYEQGAGRVDMARALEQDLTMSPASIDFGQLAFPHEEPVTTTVTITNHADAPATIDLAAHLQDSAGDGADSQIAVEPATLTVPGGGSGQVEVTFTPRRDGHGSHSGRFQVLDSNSGVEMFGTAIGANPLPPGHTLRLTAVPPQGWPNERMTDWALWTLVRVDAEQPVMLEARQVPSADVWVPDGVYAISVSFLHVDPSSGAFAHTELVDPEVVVSGADHEVVLDGTAAVPLRLSAPQPTQLLTVSQTMVRETTYGGSYRIGWAADHGRMGAQLLRVTPTEPVTVASARFITGIEAIDDITRLDVLGADAPTVDPTYLHYYFQAPKLDVQGDLQLVDVGSGSAEAVERSDLRGNLALLTRTWQDGFSINNPGVPVHETLMRLREAGAVGAVLAVDVGVPTWCGPPIIDGGAPAGCEPSAPLPVLRLGPGEVQQLRSYTGGEPVPVRLSTATDPSVAYRLHFTDPVVPDDGRYQVRADELATVESHYNSSRPRDIHRITRQIEPDGASVATRAWLPGQTVRTEYVGPVSDDVLWWTLLDGAHPSERDNPDGLISDDKSEEAFEVFDRAERIRTTWGMPSGLGSLRLPVLGELAGVFPFHDGCVFCRDGQNLYVFPESTYSDGTHSGENYLWAALAGDAEVHLYRDGAELPTPIPALWDLSQYPQRAHYRLTHRVNPAYTPHPAEISSEWEFTSEHPTSDESVDGFECQGQGGPDAPPGPKLCRVERLLQLSWDFAAGLTVDNTAPAPGAQQLTVYVYRQPGAPPSAVDSFDVQVSYDSGEHWQPARTAQVAGDGAYRVVLVHPARHGAGTTVSLRAEAVDDAGNRVQQTVIDAFELQSRRGGAR